MAMTRDPADRCRQRSRKLFPGALGLDGIPDFCGHIRTVQPRDGANAGRRGDVDLGEVAVDHVDADEQQAELAQLRANGGADRQGSMYKTRASEHDRGYRRSNRLTTYRDTAAA